jgi:glutaminase
VTDFRLSRRGLARAAVAAGLSAVGSDLVAEPRSGKGDARGPKWSLVEPTIRAAHERYRGLSDGKNLDHPVLSKMPSGYFGIALADSGGRMSFVGDVEPEFSIQSIGKVFTLALVLQESDSTVLEERIGLNATGRVFNSIEAIEAFKGKNQNPFVTPGAIATTASVKGGSAEEKWRKILAIQSEFAGRNLSLNQDVYKASSATNQRNRAIGALMSAYDRFDGDPVQATDLYTRQCSISVNTKDLAVMAATLAAGGRNPVTRRQVVPPMPVPGILALMATAGLYDRSGQWLFHTGLPAKSGVGGGIIAIAPGRFGVATFAPPLDDAGNSVRGQKAIADIGAALGANVFA